MLHTFGETLSSTSDLTPLFGCSSVDYTIVIGSTHEKNDVGPGPEPRILYLIEHSC